MEDEPVLESATMGAMDIFELFQIVGDDIVYDASKAIYLIQAYGDLRVRKALARYMSILMRGAQGIRTAPAAYATAAYDVSRSALL